MSKLTFQDSRGEIVDIRSITATLAKGEFASMLEHAARGGAVAITRHDKPQAVLISYHEFQTMAKIRKNRIDQLSARFDGMLAEMQTAKVRKAMKQRFHASPAEIGRAAVIESRKRRSLEGK